MITRSATVPYAYAETAIVDLCCEAGLLVVKTTAGSVTLNHTCQVDDDAEVPLRGSNTVEVMWATPDGTECSTSHEVVLAGRSPSWVDRAGAEQPGLVVALMTVLLGLGALVRHRRGGRRWRIRWPSCPPTPRPGVPPAGPPRAR